MIDDDNDENMKREEQNKREKLFGEFWTFFLLLLKHKKKLKSYLVSITNYARANSKKNLEREKEECPCQFRLLSCSSPF